MDILVIKALIAELRPLLTNSRIDKVVEERDGAFRLFLRSRGCNRQLLICANPGAPRLYLSALPGVAAQHPSPLLQFLKSRITGGRITGISQDGIERVVRIGIESGGPFEARGISLFIELPGGSARIIVVDQDGIILSCQRPSSPDDSHRGIIPGLHYTPPLPRPGIPFDCPFDRISKPVPLHEISGLSPTLKKELIIRAGSEEPSAILNEITRLRGTIDAANFQPTVYPAEIGSKGVLSAIPLRMLGGRSCRSSASMSEAAEIFYTESAATSDHLLRERLIALLRRHNKKVQHAEATVLKELAAWEDATDDMLRGQTLLAWKAMVPKGASMVELSGPDEGLLSIALDPTLSVSANAERYFKRYKKSRRGVGACTERLKILAAEAEYVENMLTSVDTASDNSDILLIEEELRREGYLGKKTAPRKHGKKEPSFQPRTIKIGEWDIWIGRSAGDNDNLLRHAAPDDIWLHAHGFPGSHVIIRNPNRREIPADVLGQAATLAARHSRARNEGRVEVAYCARKFVRKPSGARPGLVTISEFRTATIKGPF